MEDAAGFAALFKRVGVPDKATVELLPYHEYGKVKYEELGMAYTMGAEAHVSKEQVAAFAQALRGAGITIIHT